LERAFRQSLCEVRLYCAPDPDHGFFQQCAATYPLSLHRQQGANLGERMQTAFADALHTCRHVVLIGCDCPSLTVENLQQAFAVLIDGADLVLGPAEDGGYVLIGMSQSQVELFANMPWGSNMVMTETRRRVIEVGLKLHELAEQWDVDTVEDWRRFQNL
jgi:uncharacterized protein